MQKTLQKIALKNIENNKPIKNEKLLLLLTLAFVMHSCEIKTKKEKSAQIQNRSSLQKPTEANPISSEFKSPLRPNEKLELGKIYTDKVQYIKFDDNGDNWLVIVKMNSDTIGLIYDKEQPDFFKGEDIEINWKMDSIRYAGDSEFLNYTEYLISGKRLKPFKLTDKKVKFLWRENRYIEEWKTEINTIELNQKYISTIAEPEKAALAYVATFLGNDCEWNGKANENRSNLKCKILWALDLGYQCSYTHLNFLRFWFRNDKEILKELEICPTTPDGATIQDTFDEINLEIEGNIISVFFKANGINMREEETWNWTEKHFFEFKKNELILLKKNISPVERGTFKVREN